MPAIGKHCILELYGCPTALLTDEKFIEALLREASKRGMSTLLKQLTHRFEPHGVTSLALLAESHISIHTWPEYGYAAVDAFTCGETADPVRACRYIAEQMQAVRSDLRIVERGALLAQQPRPPQVAEQPARYRPESVAAAP